MTIETAKLEAELVGKYGETERPRVARGLKQAAEFWRPADGDTAAFDAFARANFAGTPAARQALFDRMQKALESLDGYMTEINRDFRMQADLDRGEVFPFDEALAGYDPTRARHGRFLFEQARFHRSPEFPGLFARGEARAGRPLDAPAVGRGPPGRPVCQAHPGRGQPRDRQGRRARPSQYIAEYNIWMHHLVDDKGAAPLPAEDAAALALEPARRDQGRLRGRGDGTRQAADDRKRSWSASSTQTIPQAVINNPAGRLEPVHQRGQARGRQGLRRREDRCPPNAARRAGARHALRDASRRLPGGAPGRPLLADRPDAHRAQLRRETGRSPRRACARCSKTSSPRRSCRRWRS